MAGSGATGVGERSWTIPGCSAMQRNHWPPSLTTVVPAATPAHRRLVSPVRNPAKALMRGWLCIAGQQQGVLSRIDFSQENFHGKPANPDPVIRCRNGR